MTRALWRNQDLISASAVPHQRQCVWNDKQTRKRPRPSIHLFGVNRLPKENKSGRDRPPPPPPPPPASPPTPTRVQVPALPQMTLAGTTRQKYIMGRQWVGNKSTEHASSARRMRKKNGKNGTKGWKSKWRRRGRPRNMKRCDYSSVSRVGPPRQLLQEPNNDRLGWAQCPENWWRQSSLLVQLTKLWTIYYCCRASVTVRFHNHQRRKLQGLQKSKAAMNERISSVSEHTYTRTHERTHARTHARTDTCTQLNQSFNQSINQSIN